MNPTSVRRQSNSNKGLDKLSLIRCQTKICSNSHIGCGTCNGTGAEGATQPATCPTCAGMGKVRAQQGFFTVERTCPTCSGRGQIIKNPCKACAGAGRVRKDRSLNVSIPAGVETGTRIRLAGEGEAGMRGVRGYSAAS